MYKTFKALLAVVWVLDILNMPFMEFLDTTYPINGWAWFLIWLFLPTNVETVTHKFIKDKD